MACITRVWSEERKLTSTEKFSRYLYLTIEQAGKPQRLDMAGHTRKVKRKVSTGRSAYRKGGWYFSSLIPGCSAVAFYSGVSTTSPHVAMQLPPGA